MKFYTAASSTKDVLFVERLPSHRHRTRSSQFGGGNEPFNAYLLRVKADCVALRPSKHSKRSPRIDPHREAGRFATTQPPNHLTTTLATQGPGRPPISTHSSTRTYVSPFHTKRTGKVSQRPSSSR